MAESNRKILDTECIPSLEDFSPIIEYYKDKSIFITGATGFVGKILLEKLLRSCNGLKKVYILLRSKDGEDIKQRLENLLNIMIFDKIKKQNPEILNKVVPINGDITLPNLGISNHDMSTLLANVSIVFHCAATVRFDEPLKRAVNINIIGTKKVMEICKNMKELKALIHVSTAYSFCNRKEIDEIVYSEQLTAQQVIEASQWMDEDLLDCIVPKLLNGRPTTYHYTKALAENLLLEQGENLPIAIVRPSIVSATWQEPIPGWIDNLNGPSAFIVATGKGFLRTMLVYRDTTVDIVPVDIVSNAMITVSWRTGTKKSRSTMVYNCTSDNHIKFTWGMLERHIYPLVLKYPSMEVYRYPGGSFKSNRFVNQICLKVEHGLPAVILDLVAKLTGNKPRFVELYKRMLRAMSILQYFTTNEWTFYNDNLSELRDELQGNDKKTFNFDLRHINMSVYLENYVRGLRRFILHEDDATLPAARRKLTRLYYLGKVLRLSIAISLLRIVMTRSHYMHHIWWSLISLCARFYGELLQKFTPS
ncbi:fatty acyl-CoA reductase 1-like isoform X1 [Centruroides sculpturatus]|uniref:fatty acyl-CoA reductase 1-like isoform X1 n=1 Tax=Centruroides sculpturatus TaxID=218467 RepID=UPI000C6D338A|nr:fatty acyl-CoA reductase 1-like isoform X1 [Centruroides sculpturatus]